MKTVALISTHLLVFVLGIRFAEWSAREDHATARVVGRWLRSWFISGAVEPGARQGARLHAGAGGNAGGPHQTMSWQAIRWLVAAGAIGLAAHLGWEVVGQTMR
jgi:hypothetical protein